MFELEACRCPECRTAIHEELVDGAEFICSGCGRIFRVLREASTGSIGFVPSGAGAVVEPLHLPQGSVRALATFVLAGACWVLMLSGRQVPDYLLSLLLTVIAYYFGYRKKASSAQSRIYDAAAKADAPLFLPGGMIRFALIGGFAACGVVLYAAGKMGQMEYLEFYAILLGLVVGYIFGKVLGPLGGTTVGNQINHIKGVVVLGASLWLFVLLMAERGADGNYLGLGLACVVSFYFGSRS